MEKIGSQVQHVVLTLIRFYQRWISAMFPPRCRFIPTCSSYTIEAIETFGIGKGLWLGITRLLRCHPWGKAGYDPVPEKSCSRHAEADNTNNSSGVTAQIRGND